MDAPYFTLVTQTVASLSIDISVAGVNLWLSQSGKHDPFEHDLRMIGPVTYRNADLERLPGNIDRTIDEELAFMVRYGATGVGVNLSHTILTFCRATSPSILWKVMALRERPARYPEA